MLCLNTNFYTFFSLEDCHMARYTHLFQNKNLYPNRTDKLTFMTYLDKLSLVSR